MINSEENKLIIRDEKIGDYGKIVCFEREPYGYGYVEKLSKWLGNMDKTIDLYLRTENYRVKELVEFQMDELVAFDIHYFNLDELMVMNLIGDDFSINNTPGLLEDWSDRTFETIDDIAKQVGRANVLMVGFSPISESVLNVISNNSVINPLRNVKVTIIDKAASGKFDKYNDYKTMIDNVMDYELIDMDTNSRNLKNVVLEREREEPFSAVLFCEEEIYSNIVNIDRIKDIVENKPVAVYAKDSVSSDSVLNSVKQTIKSMQIFGDPNHVLTKDIIIDESMLQKSKEFNAYYNRLASEMMGYEISNDSVESQWHSLSNVKKESSMYQTMHRDVKEMLIRNFSELKKLEGIDIVEDWKELVSGKSVSQQVSIIENDTFMNYMTALEHKRWNNFYYMRDFTFGNIKDEKNKKHDCLIDDWDEFLGGIQRDKAIYDFISTLSL